MSFPLVAFTGFAIASAFTPGPNNIMLAAASASYGVRRVMPMLLGIQFGFGFMVAAVGFGLAGPLTQVPALQNGLRWIGLVWLLWLAWKIATAPVAETNVASRPALGFVGAMLIQLLNPKAWLLCVAVATSWIAPDSPLTPQVVMVSTVFFVIGLPASALWVAIGLGAAKILDTPRRMRWFNLAMGVLLAASVLPLALGR